ncbi:hypothetical protein BDI4_540004 [Burkholderia diffusa]|nr:hypothetical protein BDI4_540004 [Burkholderia diffusa]
MIYSFFPPHRRTPLCVLVFAKLRSSGNHCIYHTCHLRTHHRDNYLITSYSRLSISCNSRRNDNYRQMIANPPLHLRRTIIFLKIDNQNFCHIIFKKY